jgi:hypothetical protein
MFGAIAEFEKGGLHRAGARGIASANEMRVFGLNKRIESGKKLWIDQEWVHTIGYGVQDFIGVEIGTGHEEILGGY